MTIRTATLEDLEQLVELFDQYRVWYRKISDKVKAAQFLKERIELKESVIFIVDLDGQAVGFTQLYPIFSSTRMKRMWLLNDLYVAEKHRGKGLSKALITAAKKHCEKTAASGILLETEQSNTIGNNLYPSQGFHLEENNFYFWTNNLKNNLGNE